MELQINDKWFLVKVDPILNENGNYNGAIHFISDITERKHAEESLLQSESHLKQAAILQGIIFAHTDTDLRYTWVFNPHSNFDSDSIIGKLDTEINDNEGTRKLMLLKQQVIDTEVTQRMDISFPISDKEDIYDVIGEPLKNTSGEVTGVSTSALLITERKLAEGELLKTSERLELSMDAGEHGLWDWNLDTNDVYFSPSYFTMLGYEPGELPMKLETWINLMHPDDKKTIVSEVENYVKNAQAYEVEFRLKTKDGNWKWISGRGKFFKKDKDGISHRAV